MRKGGTVARFACASDVPGRHVCEAAGRATVRGCWPRLRLRLRLLGQEGVNAMRAYPGPHGREQ